MALSIALATPLHAAPGQLDAGFGTDGVVTTNISGNSDQIQGVAVQPDGKIVVAGQSGYSSGNTAQLARYLSNGELDTSFDLDGIVTTAYADSARVYSVALQTDGKIVVAGDFISANQYGGLVLRYNPDGSLDTSFGRGGIVATLAAVYSALTIQPDGKILAAGGADNRLAVVRYNTDGSLDTSFGGRGISRGGSFGTYSYANTIALQPDGAILTAGTVDDIYGNRFMIVARHTAGGSIDTSFGKNGSTLVKMDKLSYFDSANGIALQADGRIVIMGSALSITAFDCDMALARINTNGTLDSTFGDHGRVLLPDYSGVDYCARAGAIQPDGKILAAGINRGKMAGLRLNTNGALDNTFGVGGEVSTIDTYYGANAIALQPDGKILIGGSSSDYALVRLLANDANNDGLAEPWDLTPDGFTFSEISDVSTDSLQVSNPITVTGLGVDVSAPIQITGGEYSKNGEAYTSLSGSVKNGDVVSVRHTSANASGSSVHTTLSIGGMYAPNNPALQISAEAPQSGTFTSTTSIAPSVAQ